MPTQLHRTLMLPGPAGRIETILWSTSKEGEGAQPPLAAVVCHPHPLFGGTMHNKVVYQTAKTIHRFGLPVVRFNFRGVGLSEGTHDKGAGELDDVLAVLDFLAQEFPGVPLLVAGFSFGSWVGLARRLRRSARDGTCRSRLAGRRSGQPQLLLSRSAAISRSFWCPANSTGSARRTSCARWSSSFLHTSRKRREWRSLPAGITSSRGICPSWTDAIAGWLLERHPELAARDISNEDSRRGWFK